MTSQRIDRREFLKLAGAAFMAAQMPYISMQAERDASAETPNILILVFDAFSARNIALHGYQRQTTPNLARLAERATVFHNHYAGGNYTFPGTSTLLTGTYPWTHRGFTPHMGIDPAFEQRNLFSAFNQYHRLAYTHNPVAFALLKQMQLTLDRLKPRQDLYLDRDFVSDLLFANDEDIASVSWWQSIVKKGRKGTYSLFFSHIYRTYKERILEKYAESYPRGIPNIRDDNFFLLEDAIDWTLEQVPQLPQPFLGYFHYLPPHDPYFTRHEFIDAFRDDGFQPLDKPQHVFTRGRTYEEMAFNRRWYDEFILLVDAEFGRMFSQLERSGILENTILVLTSDHGEMFERGIEKHYHETLHQPVIQMPLLIFQPGQTERHDIFQATSAADLLPTLLHLTGQPTPDWCEGEVLPPYRAQPLDHQRAVFAVEAKESSQYGEIMPGSFMIVKDGYKLTYYTGWPRQKKKDPLIELYHILEDPEELEDLRKTHKDVRDDLLNELSLMVQQKNRGNPPNSGPYRSQDET